MTGEQSELNEILDLSLIADVLQILNFWLNLKQVSSDALMQELKNQDSSYLDKLIEGQQAILTKLASIETLLKGNLNVLAEAGLSKQKSELVLRKFCEEHCRDRVSYDLAMHPTTCSKKLTAALWKIKAALNGLDCWDSSSIVELSYLPRHIFATTSPQQILHFVLL